MDLYSVDKLMAQTRKLAAEYRQATGQPLPVTAEIANYDVSRLLDLELIQPPPGGYDALGRSGPWRGKKIQIKGRAIFDEKKSGQRIGQVKQEQEWDSIMLLLMDENYEPVEIYEADRDAILAALEDKAGQSEKRSKRGAMSVNKFRNISQLIWTREEGIIEDEVWDNFRDA